MTHHLACKLVVFESRISTVIAQYSLTRIVDA